MDPAVILRAFFARRISRYTKGDPSLRSGWQFCECFSKMVKSR